MVAAAVFVAGILVGADSMSRAIAVPTYIADVIVAASLISMLVASRLRPLPGPLALDMASDILDIVASVPFWVAVLRIATPLVFGTLGVLLCERAGVLNLGIEGIMVVGAFTGWLAVYQGAGLWTGVLVAALAGSALGLLHAILTVPLGLSQHVSGLGVTLFGTSLASYAYRRAAAAGHHTADDRAVRADDLAGHTGARRRDDRSRSSRSSACRCSRTCSNRSPLGLAVRMVGENPGAAEGQGIDVIAVRMGTVVAGSALMGVAGAFLTLSAFNAFFFNMVNGRGWICVALVVFASWRPGKALVGAILLFAAFDALQLRLQQASGAKLPYQVYLMLPYALSILALVLMARRAAYPQALMKPYRKGER